MENIFASRHPRSLVHCSITTSFFNIALLGLVDANYKCIYTDVGSNGRGSDAGVYRNSTISRALEGVWLNIRNGIQLVSDTNTAPMTIVADDAFPLKPYRMKPYPDIGLDRNLHIFNCMLSRARRVVENAFGILANHFRVLRTVIALSPTKAELAVLAVCVLHNYLRESELENVFEREDRTSNQVLDGQWQENSVEMLGLTTHSSNNSSPSARVVRDKLCRYFQSDGRVPWQWNIE